MLILHLCYMVLRINIVNKFVLNKDVLFSATHPRALL